MGEFVYLKATEARKMTETTGSVVLKNHVYKAIKEAAKDGLAVTYWRITDCCDTALRNLLDCLHTDGYQAQLDEDNSDLLIIRW